MRICRGIYTICLPNFLVALCCVPKHVPRICVQFVSAYFFSRAFFALANIFAVCICAGGGWCAGACVTSFAFSGENRCRIQAYLYCTMQGLLTIILCCCYGRKNFQKRMPVPFSSIVPLRRACAFRKDVFCFLFAHEPSCDTISRGVFLPRFAHNMTLLPTAHFQVNYSQFLLNFIRYVIFSYMYGLADGEQLFWMVANVGG